MLYLSIQTNAESASQTGFASLHISPFPSHVVTAIHVLYEQHLYFKHFHVNYMVCLHFNVSYTSFY
jgi:hypothetical protein